MTVCAGVSFSRTSAPLRSWACPGVRRKPVGLPNASTVACILVLRPPLLRPRACLSGSPLLHLRCAGGRARWWHQSWRIRCPHPAPRPRTHVAIRRYGSRVTGVHDAKVAETGRQIPPRNTCTVAGQHAVHEQSIVFCSGSGLPCLSRQQVFDAIPLHITEDISFTHRVHLALGLQLSTAGGLIDDTF